MSLSTLPDERRVLPVVHAGCVIPRKTECVYMALRSMGKGEAVSGGMAGVFEVQRLGAVGIDALCAFGGHIDRRSGVHGPLEAVAFERDGCCLDPQELSDERGECGHRSTRGTAGNG